ncbi:hypothetical protein KIL84_023084 [Mauremys mutica]|uniref:Uncharacterized protein n=1 Tax=Mauremys mutica TaxID=74926 RepID=A0A9D4ARE6_9SAUR|nr:hypothetical protein KIL84_023084 [Mauremys mutica]
MGLFLVHISTSTGLFALEVTCSYGLMWTKSCDPNKDCRKVQDRMAQNKSLLCREKHMNKCTEQSKATYSRFGREFSGCGQWIHMPNNPWYWCCMDSRGCPLHGSSSSPGIPWSQERHSNPKELSYAELSGSVHGRGSGPLSLDPISGIVFILIIIYVYGITRQRGTLQTKTKGQDAVLRSLQFNVKII